MEGIWENSRVFGQKEQKEGKERLRSQKKEAAAFPLSLLYPHARRREEIYSSLADPPVGQASRKNKR